jgi:phosphotriesterase-related protein
MAQVMTVLGPVDADSLGVTLPHEHLLIDLSCYLEKPSEASELAHFEAPVRLENLGKVRRSPYGNRDNCLLTDIELAVAEAIDFKGVGGGTICDLTNADLGRDPLALREIAARTGLNVIAGCGHYLEMAQPSRLRELTASQLGVELVREVHEGIDDTGVRPGVIGEIGTGDPITAAEVKVLQAAAIAQKATGLPISVHVHPSGRRGHDVLDHLAAAGADLSAVVLGHLDASIAHPGSSVDDAVAYISSLAARGCFVEFDLCGNDGFFYTKSASWWLPSDRERAAAAAKLATAGHGDRLLFSQDVGHKHYLTRYGGWGYRHVPSVFATILRASGISNDDIRSFLVDNPRRMLLGLRAS